MSSCVLINPRAGPSSSNEPLLEILRNEKEYEIRQLKPDEDRESLLAAVAGGGYERIVVAGGDGTVHALVNALLNVGSRTTLGIIPLGTGNDLCRTLAIPLDPQGALRLLRSGEVRPIDAVRVEGGRAGFFVNAAAGGFSGLVAAEVTSETKGTWGPFAYMRGAVGPLTNLPRFRLSIRVDGGPVETVEVLNIAVANGRTAAGGLQIAPGANPEDGLLDLVLVRFSESLDLTLLASRLMHGNYLDDASVDHRLATRVEIASDTVLPFSIDGERCDGCRFTFEVVPQALRIVVGPGYSAVSIPEPPIEVEAANEATIEPRPARERLFGLITALLLVVKRIRSGPNLLILGIALVLLLSVWLAQGVAAGEWRELNERVHRSSRVHATESLDRLALLITWLGGGWGVALIASVTLLQLTRTRHYLTAGTFLAVVIGVLLLEAVLKPFFALARPVTTANLESVTGYAFPSGHALRGVGIYGLLAALAAARARRSFVNSFAAAICAAVAIGICWSRVYLGVHWLTDVIMGAMLAAAWVSICLLARHQVELRSASRDRIAGR